MHSSWRALSTAAAEQSGKHVPWGALGSGTYTAATKGCFDVIGRCSTLALAALDRSLAARKRRNLPAGTPFQIADFGTADGGTSIPLMGSIVRYVRAAEPETPIVVLYEDQHQNDWNSLFKLTQGLMPDGPATYLDDVDNVYVLASGASFYQQCFAPGTVDFGLCATAMHWLTSVPTNIPDALHSACTQDTAAKAAFAAQAAKDWEQILLHRAAELTDGGQMVIANFAVDETGQFLGTSHRVSARMHDTFSELWLNVAGAEIHRATNFCNEYRSLEACAAPFQAGANQPVHAAGLSLISAETDVVPCPYNVEWLEGTGPHTGDAAAQAAYFVPTTRTWSNSTFVSGAMATGVPAAKAAEMADDMFARYVARVAEAPADHAMDYCHSYLHIAKEA